MAIGQLGGLDFRMDFPTPPQPAGQGGITPVDVEVPEYSNDPIAVREKLTSDYYNNMGLLRSFAQDMAKKGINVFEPDWSQDGGGVAYQTAKKLEAGVLYAANALANEFKAEQQTRPYELTGATRLRPGAERDGLYYSDPNNFISTKLPAGVEEVNRRLSQETNTLSDQERANELIAFENQKIDRQVDQGFISPEEGEYYKQQIIPNKYRTQVYAPRSGSGLKPEDIQGRAEFIKQIKRGIITNDPTALNTLKLVPNVEDVEYINTGDKVGINMWLKGQPQPAFIDLQRGGEGEINAILNRIEGQKNVPNEAISQFDTRVDLPPSNVRQVIDEVKKGLSSFNKDTIATLQELAANRKLMLENGEPVASVELDGPWMGFIGGNDLEIKYYPIKNNKIDYTRTTTKKISDPAELEAFIELNVNQVAPAFGGGFVTNSQEIDPDI